MQLWQIIELFNKQGEWPQMRYFAKNMHQRQRTMNATSGPAEKKKPLKFKVHQDLEGSYQSLYKAEIHQLKEDCVFDRFDRIGRVQVTPVVSPDRHRPNPELQLFLQRSSYWLISIMKKQWSGLFLVLLFPLQILQQTFQPERCSREGQGPF